MIPTELNVNHLLTNLPARATGVEAMRTITGGCKHQYKCWMETQNGFGRSHDYFLGHVEHTKENGDSLADDMCLKKFYKSTRFKQWNRSYSGMHSQWMGCF